MPSTHNRFDYIGFANGGKEIGPEADSSMLNAFKGTANALKGGLEYNLRTTAIPLAAASDVANMATRGLASAGNWLLGKATGYEVPYKVNLPENQSGQNLARLNEMTGTALESMGLRKLPQKRGAIPVNTPNNGNVGAALNMSGATQGAMGGVPEIQNKLPVMSAPRAIPDSTLTPMGTFQVAGGPKRSFSADSSGAWYEGGNKMGGIMGAPSRSGNPAVNDIVNRLMANQPASGVGRNYDTGIQDPSADAKFRTEVEQAIRVNAANGMAPTTEQMKITGMSGVDLVTLLGAHNKEGRYDKQIGDIFKNEFLDNARTQLETQRMALPIEADLKGAQGDYYRAHAKQLLTMSDPNLLLKIKGKDADTERVKAQGDVIKTLLPKAYETATDLTKKYLETNPNADANDVFNSYFSNAMSSFTDNFSQGQRYAPGIQMPGTNPWFGFKAPEVNIPGGWVDPVIAKLRGVVAPALQAAGDDGLKRTEIINLFNQRTGELRSRSQAIPD